MSFLVLSFERINLKALYNTDLFKKKFNKLKMIRTRTETEVVLDFPEAEISWRQSFVFNWNQIVFSLRLIYMIMILVLIYSLSLKLILFFKMLNSTFNWVW